MDCQLVTDSLNTLWAALAFCFSCTLSFQPLRVHVDMCVVWTNFEQTGIRCNLMNVSRPPINVDIRSHTAHAFTYDVICLLACILLYSYKNWRV